MADKADQEMLPYGVEIKPSSVEGISFRPIPADVMLDLDLEDGGGSDAAAQNKEFSKVMLFHGLCNPDGGSLPGISSPEDVGRLAGNVFLALMQEYQEAGYVPDPKPTPETPSD